MSSDDVIALVISVAVPAFLILWPAFWYSRGRKAERRRWTARVAKVNAETQQRIEAANENLQAEWNRRLEQGPGL